MRVEQVECKLAGADPTGRIVHGSLTLLGQIEQVVLVCKQDSGHSLSQSKCYNLEMAGVNVGRFRADFPLCQMGEDYVEPGTILYCLLLDEIGALHRSIGRCLVLQLVSKESHLYKRVGFLSESGNQEEGILFYKFRMKDTAAVIVTII
jgi:hypothetical protein